MDRFDLEQAIMTCWNTADDIDLVIKTILDSPGKLDTDKVANLLIGLRELHNLRANHAIDVLEELIVAGQFCEPQSAEATDSDPTAVYI
jgi:hypothetical protein